MSEKRMVTATVHVIVVKKYLFLTTCNGQESAAKIDDRKITGRSGVCRHVRKTFVSFLPPYLILFNPKGEHHAHTHLKSMGFT